MKIEYLSILALVQLITVMPCMMYNTLDKYASVLRRVKCMYAVQTVIYDLLIYLDYCLFIFNNVFVCFNVQ